MMSQEIVFEVTPVPDIGELLAFNSRQGHRVTASPERMRSMVGHTHCLVTARRDGELIGLARGVTDGIHGWLAECKLDASCQGPACITRTEGRIEHDDAGVAAEMARRVIQALNDCGVERIETLAHSTEVDFCEELGFRPKQGLVAMTLAPKAFAGRVASSGSMSSIGHASSDLGLSDR